MTDAGMDRAVDTRVGESGTTRAIYPERWGEAHLAANVEDETTCITVEGYRFDDSEHGHVTLRINASGVEITLKLRRGEAAALGADLQAAGGIDA